VVYDPISEEKSLKLFIKNILSKITILKPNLKNLLSITNYIKREKTQEEISAISGI
jgi:hypothetical protein